MPEAELDSRGGVGRSSAAAADETVREREGGRVAQGGPDKLNSVAATIAETDATSTSHSRA